MARVVTFGEIMLRLAPNGYERFFQSDRMQATFGGGEANVAVSLANFGVDSRYVTKLPKHAIGQAAVNALRYFGVDTSEIVRGGDRVGVYYLEKGASQRGSVCIYDRAHSAIQEANPSEFDWARILDGADWFHFTGITPALGENMLEACLDACRTAREKGIAVSCDLNYRGKLWTRESARSAMTRLCEQVDVCIANEADASRRVRHFGKKYGRYRRQTRLRGLSIGRGAADGAVRIQSCGDYAARLDFRQRQRLGGNAVYGRRMLFFEEIPRAYRRSRRRRRQLWRGTDLRDARADGSAGRDRIRRRRVRTEAFQSRAILTA